MKLSQNGNLNVAKNPRNRKTPIGLYEKQLFTKWTNNLGFTIDAIVTTAKRTKRKDFDALDKKLEELYRLNVMSFEEINNYTKTKNNLHKVAKAVNKKLGVYYDDLDNIIETYTSPWLSKGFTEETLEYVANYCFLCNIKTLSGLDRILNNLYKMGFITTKAVEEFIANRLQTDDVIQNII